LYEIIFFDTFSATQPQKPSEKVKKRMFLSDLCENMHESGIQRFKNPADIYNSSYLCRNYLTTTKKT
jgi:hypothetical protein